MLYTNEVLKRRFFYIVDQGLKCQNIISRWLLRQYRINKQSSSTAVIGGTYLDDDGVLLTH